MELDPPRYDRVKRQLGEAEGYLMLNLPLKALAILESRTEWSTMQFEASLLTGETLRVLERYRDALKPLEIAASLRPGDIGVAISQGWCYKRTSRLAQAIDSITRALRHNPDVALLHYNLACYWCLANNPDKAIRELSLAIDLEPDFRTLATHESDFDAIRDHPEFIQLTAEPDTSA